MITCDFAPNESSSDSFLAFRLLFQPWRWYKGNSIEKCKKILERKFFPNHEIFFYLTGRTALFYLLQSLKLSKDTEVLVQAYTCEAVILPILENNLKPRYVDVEDTSYSMDLTDFKKKISGQTQVLILQHSYGIPPKYRNEIIELAKEKKLFIIEDMAHGGDFSLMAKDKFRTTKLVSFGRSKAFSSVFGAILAVRDFHQSQKMKRYQPTLARPSWVFIMRCLLYKIKSVPIKATYNLFIGKLAHTFFTRLNIFIPEITAKEKKGNFDLQLAKSYPNSLAVLLHHQLKRYNHLQKLRKKVVKLYVDNLHYDIPNSASIESYPLIRLPLVLNDRDKLFNYAKKQHIYLGRWYDQVIAPRQINLRKMWYTAGSCPKAENISERIINLPTNISEKDCRYVIEKLNVYFLKNA